MPQTFEDAQKESAEERPEDRGDIFSESTTVSSEESLVERFRDIRDILTIDGKEDVTVAPTEPSEGIEFPEFDIDLSELDTAGLLKTLITEQRDLLQVLIETQITSLERINTMTQFVSPATTITVSGADVTTEEDVATKVIQESVPTRKIFLRASPTNTSDIYLGDGQVEPQKGWVLRAGETLMIPMDYRNQDLYMASEETGQVIQLMGVF